MSSGHGISGGVGRCYPFFAQFKECLVSFFYQAYKLYNNLMYDGIWQLKIEEEEIHVNNGDIMYKRRSIYLMSSLTTLIIIYSPLTMVFTEN